MLWKYGHSYTQSRFDAHREWQDNKQGKSNDASGITIPPSLVDTKETRADLLAYYNEITRLDSYVGRLEQQLKDENISENTIIIFMADNGRPFTGSKTRLYDAGVKTPFILKWPKGISKQGKECKSLISAIDIAPTLLTLANVKTPASVQGTSFDKLLKSPNMPFRNYIFTEHNWHDYEAYERAVRTEKYLYVLNLRPKLANQGPLDAVNSPSFKALLNVKSNGKLTSIQEDIFLVPRPVEEFFDLKSDIYQSTNVIGDMKFRSDVYALKRILDQWQKDTADTRPVNLTKDWYGRVDGEILPAKDLRGEMPGAAAGAAIINAKGPF